MSGVGVLLRQWRERRGLSQLELGLRADVSARHVSFLETGRSRPTREMVLRLSERLDVPLRERNTLLLAAGFAPAYPEHRLGDVPMSAVSAAIGQILRAHLPYPALVVDQHWNLVEANAAVATLVDGCSADLLEPPVNVLRLSLHPDGMASRIRNLALWRAHLLDRLDHQFRATGDPCLADLHAELTGYPGGTSHAADAAALVVPLEIVAGDERLSFLTTTTVFGTPLDVTVAELAIETFHPADSATAAAFARDFRT
ncbi:MAG TPA: helix-turn-helix transcriptional regulator [Aldersonia sp.]